MKEIVLVGSLLKVNTSVGSASGLNLEGAQYFTVI